MGHQQTSIFEFLLENYKIEKPIRLIELFSGIGAQAKALEQLGADFEHWKTCDWAVPSIHAYSAIHGEYLGSLSKKSALSTYDKDTKLLIVDGVSTNYNEPLSHAQLLKKNDEWLDSLVKSIYLSNDLINIMNVHSDDLEIRDRDKYTYVMTYSFPCQDLSLAGNKKGMSVSQANGGTRSGLLWEVERILSECEIDGCLPQVLIMENVPEVVSVKNIKDFQKWRARLESLGYSNYCEILNAKDYGIPQNRRRCFMVSILGEYSYTFPRRIPLNCKLSDILEPTVDDKYFLSKKMLDCFMSDGTGSYPRRERFLSNLNRPNQDIGNSVTTLAGNRATDNFILVKNATKDGYLKATEGDGVDISTRMQHHRGTVQKKSCQTITCMGGENVGVVVDDRNLKEQLCDKLIESGEVKPGDIVKHSYTTQILEGKKKGVEKNGEMITLTTRPDCVGVVVDSPANFEKNLTIRKLTPLECLKLMGFDDKDYAKLREIGQTDMQIYHEAGDSIVVTVLMSIFGQLLGIDYEPIVEKYVKSLKTTTCSK